MKSPSVARSFAAVTLDARSSPLRAAYCRRILRAGLPCPRWSSVNRRRGGAFFIALMCRSAARRTLLCRAGAERRSAPAPAPATGRQDAQRHKSRARFPRRPARRSTAYGYRAARTDAPPRQVPCESDPAANFRVSPRDFPRLGGEAIAALLPTKAPCRVWKLDRRDRDVADYHLCCVPEVLEAQSTSAGWSIDRGTYTSRAADAFGASS